MAPTKKYLCGNCNKDVAKNSKSVSCTVCELWFHTACVEGMTDQFYESCAYAFDTWGYSAFFCKCCRKATAKMNGALIGLKDTITKLEGRIEVLEGEKEAVARRVGKVEKRAEKVKEELEGVEREIVNGMGKAMEDAKREVKSEMKKEEEISANIVVFGVEESKKESAEERKMEEMKKMEDMVQAMEIELEGEIQIKYRSGAWKEELAATKPRPLVVRITDEETRARILNNSRKLSRAEGWKRIFVSPDLSLEQREEARKKESQLREEASTKSEQEKKDKTGMVWVVVGKRGARKVISVKSRE